MIAHFYHALDTPKGRSIHAEHRDLVEASGFAYDLFEVTWVKPGEGWMDVSLRKLHAWAKTAPPGSKVLFSHTKGAHHPGSGQDHWRRAVEARLIGEWQDRVDELDEADVVCMHWLSPLDSSPGHGIVITNEFAAGSFFWARADYIASLPELPVLTEKARHAEEAWIGQGDSPRVKDLQPGFPCYGS